MKITASTALGMVAAGMVFAGQALGDGALPHNTAGWLRLVGGALGAMVAIMVREEVSSRTTVITTTAAPPATVTHTETEKGPE